MFSARKKALICLKSTTILSKGEKRLHYEWFAIFSIILCLFILLAEYLWLAILAKKQEDRKSKYDAAASKIEIMLEGIFYSPTKSSRDNEIAALKELMGDDVTIFEMISERLQERLKIGENEPVFDKSTVISEIYAALDPVELFSNMLKNGGDADVCYACRRLADFDAYEYQNEISELSKSKKRNVSYNAAMALARLGDTKGVADYILRIQNDVNYSFRIINQLIDEFCADRAELVALIFKSCDDYIKSTVIKAASRYNLTRFEPDYIQGTLSSDVDMRIACVKALGNLANPENEHILQNCADDASWVVRSAAVKGLQKLATPTAVECIKKSLGDKEWWVRQAAAGALVEMAVDPDELEDILGGYDKYAADALKYALYRCVDMKEN